MLSKKISAKEIYSILDAFDKFIFISRRDKINQSISYHIARTTGVFHADQEDWLDDLEMPAPNFDAGKILRHLSDVLREEEIWENVFKNLKKPVYRILYEDYVANYESKSREIFDFLEISIPEVPPIPTRPMKKKVTSEYRRLLLQNMGLGNASNQKSEFM
jgi:LPS sulfotransferase NodH